MEIQEFRQLKQVLSGGCSVSTVLCPHNTDRKQMISVVANGSPASQRLLSCPILDRLAAGGKPSGCQHVFLVRRGCPFVSSNMLALSQEPVPVS